MLPGLHPGLLLASAPTKLTFVGVPPRLHIDTNGGEGLRQLTLYIEPINGEPPFLFDWEITITDYVPDPASGSGQSSVPFVGFTSNVYVNGIPTNFIEVGSARLNIYDANGLTGGIVVPVTAGGSGAP